MCNCGNCGDSIISNPAGADGLNGEFGGYSSIFIYNGASTTAPPPSTSLRFNDLDPTLTTKIYVSNVKGNLSGKVKYVNCLSKRHNVCEIILSWVALRCLCFVY